MKKPLHYIAGILKILLYVRIALHVVMYYLIKPKLFNYSPIRFLRFLRRALQLLLIFRHNKIVKVNQGYKLHLYLPAYPSKAFFYAIESKLCKTPPGPTTIVFSITKACSYKCPHCYQREDQGQDLDENLMIDVAKQMQDIGVAMFDIEGGDPFMRLSRLINLIRALDERSEIWVNTTGDNVTKENLQQLKNVGLYGLMISIHSADKEKHEAFTGIPDSFATACNTFKLSHQLGIATAMNSVLSEEEINAGRLDELMDLAKELQCDYVQLIHPKASGKWLGREEQMQKEPEILQKIRKRHVFYNSNKAKDYPSLAAQVFEESDFVLGCTAGAVDRFYINANGEIQPCEFLNISFGNVQNEPFETIYKRMRSYFAQPDTDWLCCTQAQAIYKLMLKHNLTQTPIPWPITKELVENWSRGKPTPIYKKLGIYK